MNKKTFLRKFNMYICDIQKSLIMKYNVQVWFRYYSNGQSHKDMEIETVEADDEKQAKRKAADLYADKKVIPYKTEIV